MNSGLTGEPEALVLAGPTRHIQEDVCYWRSRAERLAEALRIAEAALADIGDADREPGDDVAWCERRAAQALPMARAALAQEQGEKNGNV